jgi:hypothetical protein
MHVRAVKGRSFILIHSANDAATQLKGCIAPVSALTADPGKGKESKKAYERLKATVYAALARKEPVWLNIAELATAAAPSVHY